jgi:hypothetical protein
MTRGPKKTDRSQRAALYTVGITGALLAAGAVPLASVRDAAGVAAGGLLATLNLWAIGLLVRRLLTDGTPAAPWALFAVVKLVVLFGAVYLLVFSGFADILAIVVGYGALPIGLVVAQLGAKRPADEQG